MSEHEKEHAEGGESHGSHGGGGHGGHGGGGHEEHEGAPEWLISFADNVALLMGFFVILLAMNMAPKSEGPMGGDGQGGDHANDTKMIDFVIAVREGFNTPFDLNSTRPEDQKFIRRIKEREGADGARPNQPQGQFRDAQSLERGNTKDVTARVEFDTDSAEISPTARGVLLDAAKKLKDQGYVIEVRGHCSPFEARRDFDRASTLAYDRAMAAARVLIESGIRKESLSVVSRANFDPLVAKANDAESSRSNQRVEIILSNEQVAADPFAVTTAPSED
jgi:outer membrane protein OmpA-like peptidoglycan-associated protein